MASTSSSSSTRLPHLLEPYLRLPPETALILLTGVLGTTTNWLVHRYLYTLLRTAPPPPSSSVPASAALGDLPAADGSPDGAEGGAGSNGAAPTTTTNVVLLSFLRDYAFWREGVGRLGVDLDAARRRGRLAYVDGLSALFSPLSSSSEDAAARPEEPGRRLLSTPTVEGLRRALEGAVGELRAGAPSSKTVLVLDQPDLLLAAAGPDVSGLALHEMLLDIRENVHSTLVTLSADDPLVAPQATTLEKEHAALALSLAHDAHLVLGLRMLDTGTAKDVSGVLRITSGGQHDDELDDSVEEQELLYFVGGDGGVRVFERGQ